MIFRNWSGWEGSVADRIAKWLRETPRAGGELIPIECSRVLALLAADVENGVYQGGIPTKMYQCEKCQLITPACMWGPGWITCPQCGFVVRTVYERLHNLRTPHEAPE